MDDWERSFIDKSLRRSESERRERRDRLIRAWIAATFVVLLIVAGIAELGRQ